MAVYLRQFHFSDSPLSEVNEQLMVIPSERGFSLSNSDFKFILVLQGTAFLRVGDAKPFRLSRGDVMILPQACKQHYSCAENNHRTAHLHVMLLRWRPKMPTGSGQNLFVEYLNKTFGSIRHLQASSCATLRPLIDKLYQVMRWDNLSASVIEEVSRLLVLEIAQAAGIHRAPQIPLPWQQAERDYIQLTRDPIGQLPATSENFSVWVGATPARYRNVLRVEAVKELMAHQMQPLSKLAKQVGFQSQSSFSHAFRRIAGCNPKEYFQELSQRFSRRVISMKDMPKLPDLLQIEASGSLWTPPSPSLIVALGSITQVSKRGERQTFTEDSQELIYSPSRTHWEQSEGSRSAVLTLGDDPEMIRKFGRTAKRIPLPERRLIEHLRSHLQAGREGPSLLHHQLYAGSLFKLIAAEWLHSCDPTGKALTLKSREGYRLPVDYATEYLRKNLSQTIRLADVAWFAGVSEEHLSRSFRRIYKLTVMEYLRQIRVQRAKVCLTTGDQSITEISGSCGFSNPAHFCREFKKATGMAPGSYRMRNR